MTANDPVLSIVVPIYNEGAHLAEVMEYLLSSPCPVSREWLFVDDGSTDDSLKILKEFAAQGSIQLFEQTVNQGKGAAVIRGIREARGQLIMIQDADFEYDPNDVPSLLEPLLDNRADVVFGSRFRPNTTQVHRTYHYLVNRMLTIMSNLLSGIYLTDMETCYKIFRADLLKSMQLKSDRFGIEVELTAYTAKSAARIIELPIHYYPRTKLQAKKIGWKDGVAALFHLIRFNLIADQKSAFKNLPAAFNPEMKRSAKYLSHRVMVVEPADIPVRKRISAGE